MEGKHPEREDHDFVGLSLLTPSPFGLYHSTFAELEVFCSVVTVDFSNQYREQGCRVTTGCPACFTDEASNPNS